MRAKRYILASTGAVIAALFLTLTAHAAEEGGAAGAETATEIFKWINFAIVAGALLWVCLRKAPGFFRGRAEAISSAITKAGSAKAAADAQLREAETKLANLDKEVAELRAFAEREAAAEVERIRTATRSDLEKIAAAAKAEIEAAERAARLELKAVAARLAVDGAEALLVKQLNAQAQAGLISNFVKSLEGMPN
jgi:F-type H+-transporting ATPase subunit b